MPSFIEQRLLDCVSLGFQGGPTFVTQKVQMRSGMERRNALRSRPKYRFVAPYENKGLDDHALIINAFNACMGGAIGFRFKDWADYQAFDEPLGLSPAGSTPVQLIKTYSFGPTETARLIRKPVSAIVYENGATKAGSLDLTTGIFTPAAPWVAIPTPSNVQVTGVITGGTIPAGTSSYLVTALNGYGESIASAPVTVVNTGTTSRNVITWDAVYLATAYKVYGRTSGSELYIDATVGGVFSFTDTGSITPAGAPPIAGAPADLSWTGEFDVPVTFGSDELLFDWVNKQILSASIELEEDFAA